LDKGLTLGPKKGKKLKAHKKGGEKSTKLKGRLRTGPASKPTTRKEKAGESLPSEANNNFNRIEGI